MSTAFTEPMQHPRRHSNGEYYDDQQHLNVVDSELEYQHDYRQPFKAKQPSILTKLKNVITISEILRILGASAVIASMSLFLLNGWTEGNDIQRYLKLLTQTGLLTLAGFALSFALKENKGARLFFALALISVVANFTILGALTYSLFQLDGNLIDYPSMVTWTVVSASSFWPVFLGAIVALTVLARFSFSIFARGIATPLTISFLLMNSLLLIPVRSSGLISLVAALAFVMVCFAIKKITQNKEIVYTKETKFTFALLFAPAVLIVARAITLYQIDTALMVLISGLLYGLFRFASQKVNQASLSGVTIRLMNYISGIALVLSSIEIIPHIHDSINVIIFSILTLAIGLDQRKISHANISKQRILSVTTLVIVLANLFNGANDHDLISTVLSLMTCIALLFMANRFSSYEFSNKISKIIALLGAVISFGFLLIQILEIINLGNWMLIGIAGATFIVLGSLYERFGLRITSLISSTESSNQQRMELDQAN